MSTAQEKGGTHGRRSRFLPFASLMVLYWLLTAPVILSGRGGPSEAKDQDRHHAVVIETMLAEWPDIDIVGYTSATSPGYHIALAAINKATGGATVNMPLLRWCNALLSMALLAAVHQFARRYAESWAAAALCLPLLLSPYFLGAAIFLTTDNAALLFVVIALGGALFLRRRPSTDLWLGLAGAGAVGVRQIHAWIAAPIGFAGLLASPLALRLAGLSRIAGPGPFLWRNLAIGVVAALFPVALLGWFVWLWGGLMPPEHAGIHNTGMNPATFPFALALVGAFGVWFVPLVGIDVRQIVRRREVWFGTAIGLACGVASATSYTPPGSGHMPPRAYGALWRLVERAPTLGDRSVLLAALAALGGGALAWLARSAIVRGRRRETVVLLLSLLGWALAQSLNSMAWQRYFEPMLLIALAWLAAMGARDDAARLTWRWAGVGLLAGTQAGLSGLSLYREVMDAGAPG